MSRHGFRDVEHAPAIIHPRSSKEVFLDVTERKLAERTRSLLASIVESSEDAIVSTDARGIITSWNPSATMLFGYKSEEAVGQCAKRAIPPNTRQLLWRARSRLRKGERIGPFDSEWQRKDGSLICLSTTIASIHDPLNRILGYAAILRDVTARKRAEDEMRQARDLAIESARMRSEFMANMSHEIRTPLNGIIGMAELLRNTSLTPEQQEYADAVWSSTGLLLSIVNDVLDFSKLAAGKLILEQIDVDLVESVEAALEPFAEQAQKKNIELVAAIDNNVPHLLKGDPLRLRQILTNLISNAVKFTQRGEIVVRAHWESETETEVTILFEVIDTGIGIDAAAQTRLFQPFSQADGSTSRKYGGTGLGLAISRQLIEHMGGTIEVDSRPGFGSKFRFTAQFEKQQSRTSAFDDRRPLYGMRVLVVDDSATNRRILIEQLASWGATADALGDAAAALAALRGNTVLGRNYHMVLLDAQIPKTDVLATVRAVKDDSTIQNTPIVAMCPLALNRSLNDYIGAGVSASLTKPLRRSRLLETLINIYRPRDGNCGELDSFRLQASNEPETAPTDRHSGTILVVEDNPVNRNLALHQLRKLGYSATAVSSGMEALDAITRERYPIILMDCQMPEMDGFQTTREIRRRLSAEKQIAIIAMTAHALEGAREQCLEAGMNDYVSKPITLQALASVLRQWDKARAPASQAQENCSSLEHTDDIDSAAIRELKDLTGFSEDRQGFVKMIDLFLQDAEMRLGSMRKAIAEENRVELMRMAHALKGASASMGAKALSALSRELEQVASTETIEALTGKLVEVEKATDRVRLSLEKEKRSI